MGSQSLPGHYVNPRSTATAGSLQGRLHNFVKYALLQQLVPPGSTVCDLYCGQGTDVGKWAQAQIGRYIGVDFSASTLEEAWEQWDNHNRPYSADFCEADPCVVNLETELRYMGLPADFVTCMGHLQDCFLTEDMVRTLLQNVSSVLRPGGYFFGITADSSTIWSKYQKAVEVPHRGGMYRVLPRVQSEYYTISFEDDRFTPFGTRYTLQFGDGVIFEGQQLIHFPSFIRLAEEVGLEYMELQNLQEFYDDYRLQFLDILRATCTNLVDVKGRLPQYAHDILSLYTTFIFKKADYLGSCYNSSPFRPEEELSEACCHDLYDGTKASFLEHLSPTEMNTVHRVQAAPFEHNDAKAGQFCRLEDEQKPHPPVLQIEQKLLRADARKESFNVDYISSIYRHVSSEGNEGRKHDCKAVEDGVPVTRKEETELQSAEKFKELGVGMVETPRFACTSLLDNDPQHSVAQTEDPIETGVPPQATINSESTLDEVKEHSVINDSTSSQLQSDNREEESRATSVTVILGNEEIYEEETKKCSIEDIPVENISVSPLLSAKKLKSEDAVLYEEPTAPIEKHTSLADLEIKEMKGEESDDTKNPIHREPDTLIDPNLRKSSSPVKPDDNKPSSKERANPTAIEDCYNGTAKRFNSGSYQRNRSSRPHPYYHYSEERQEHSHALRHGHSSHSTHKRDRLGDYRNEHLSPNHRGESRRGRSQAPTHHSAPAFVPFSHFIPQTEFPIFQSPNTPGLLGPGPPVLVIEPIPLWPIPPPMERRVFPKIRASRKHCSERETSGNRSRKDSPKKHRKEPSPSTAEANNKSD
ncbi:hypothetical protein KP509_08G028900 [Ceratopteris richardii]|uniref:mRNA (guanine-N(7))-methyltransferase n=1 Tax=Ceratopteris richardii TaxID=49495 RepID=A0A8T2U8R7_CERRI|nr:hypothetical protein KP509_08G028900 [Ceratopteris richardii]